MYSLRPEPGATVSTPLTWKEVEEGGVRPEDFTIATVWDRFAKRGDLFDGVWTKPQDLDTALEAMGCRPEGALGRSRRRGEGPEGDPGIDQGREGVAPEGRRTSEQVDRPIEGPEARAST